MSEPHLSPQENKELERYTEVGSLKKGTVSYRVFCLIAGSWSLFQLALPSVLLLSSQYVRAIHLAFAITLAYLGHRILKQGNRWERWQGTLFSKLFLGRTTPVLDWILAALACFSALYLAIDYDGIAARQGMPLPRDIVVGCLLIVLLLEAARRTLGPALPIIAGAFIFYSLFSESMPEIIAFKNASLSKVVNKLVLSTEGIYGVPLDVSATTVFLFVLFGAMLEKVGGGNYFIRLAFSLLGKYRGGPAKAAVLASGLTGMVSGSSIANTVTTGTFTIPLMKRAGYPGVKAGAIEVAASTNGQLMPPIMGAAAFIIAEYCNLTYFEVVRAAFIPAVISYVALIYITHLEAGKLGLKGLPPSELPKFWPVFISGIHFLLPLGFLLYQLIYLRRSPQLSAFYAIISLGVLVLAMETWGAKRSRRPVVSGVKSGLHLLWESLVAGGQNMLSIGVAVSAAGIIVGVVTLGLGGVITDLIALASGGNLILLLVITAVASLVLGMGLPTTANYIVMASLTVPVIVVVGADNGLVVPLIAAHLFCFYFGILADDTPPVGLAAYAAAAISKEDPIATGIQGFTYDMRTALLPFMFLFNTDLLLVDIHAWWHILLIFVTGLVGMFSFASLTQNYFYIRNRIYESALLLAVMLIMFRPYYWNQFLDLTHFGWYGVGFGLYALAYASQIYRSKRLVIGN